MERAGATRSLPHSSSDEGRQIIERYQRDFEANTRAGAPGEAQTVELIRSWAKGAEYNHSSMFQQLKVAFSQRDITVSEGKGGLSTRIFYLVRVLFWGDSNERSKSETVEKAKKALGQFMTLEDRPTGMDILKTQAYSNWRFEHYEKYVGLLEKVNRLNSRLKESKYIADKIPRYMMLNGIPAAAVVVGASMKLEGFAAASPVFAVAVGVFCTGFGLLTDGGSRDAQVVDAAQRVIVEVNKLKNSSVQ